MLTLVMTVLTGFAADARGTAQAGERELKVFAKAPGRPPGAAARGHQVIRNPQELTKIMAGLGGNIDASTARVVKMLKVDKIDWNKQMLLILSGGTQRTGGYSVELTGLKVKGDELTVHWKLVAPRPGKRVTRAVSHPALTLLVERYDDTIRFDPAVAQSGIEKDER
jgi:hypothetical protein